MLICCTAADLLLRASLRLFIQPSRNVKRAVLQAQREADAAVAKQEQLRSALDNVVDGAQRELHNARAKAVADEREV